LFTICSIFISSAVRIVSSETETATMTATSASWGLRERSFIFCPSAASPPVFIDATLPEQ
jgi:hypothetical protein